MDPVSPPGRALVRQAHSPTVGLGVTDLFARVSGLGLGAAGIALRSAVEAVERFVPDDAPAAPVIVGPLGRLLHTVPGLALSTAYATRRGLLFVSAGVEGAVVGTLSLLGAPGPLAGPLDRAAGSLEVINQWAFGEQQYNELLVVEFTRRSAPAVAESLVASIDLPDVVGQLPVNQMVDRIDLNAVLAGIDFNAIIADIDIRPIANQVIDELDIPDIVRATTTSLAGELIEANRVICMYLDAGIATAADKVVRPRKPRRLRLAGYDPTAIEERPGHGLGSDAAPRSGRRARVVPADAIRSEYARGRQGVRAGFASRVAGSVLDLLFILLVTFLGSVVVGFLAFLFTAEPFALPKPSWSASVSLTGLLTFVYYAGCWTTTGRTVGDAVLGLRVVTTSGRRVPLGRAAIRALLVMAFGAPLLLWCIVSKKNNAGYDLPVRTAVIYDWTIN